MGIIRKLLLAITGGVVAASGFYWYLDRANPLLQMVQQYQQNNAVPGSAGKKLIELPDMGLEKWNKTELFDALSQSFDLTKGIADAEEKDLVGQDPLLSYWIGGMLNTKAEQTGKAPLTDESRTRMMNLLLNMRDVTQRSALVGRDGTTLTDDDKVLVAALMAKGELLFSQELGVSLSEFMATLTKEDLRMLFNPSPRV